MRTHLRLLATLAVVLVATACGTSPEGPDPSPASPATPASPAPGSPTGGPASETPPATEGSTTPSGMVTPPEGLRSTPRVAAAIADTATREGVDPAEVAVAAWSPVEWSDGSLGCPQPGMSYTQAIVPGELLILRVEQGLFQYHARTGGPFTYCADPTAAYTVSD